MMIFGKGRELRGAAEVNYNTHERGHLHCVVRKCTSYTLSIHIRANNQLKKLSSLSVECHPTSSGEGTEDIKYYELFLNNCEQDGILDLSYQGNDGRQHSSKFGPCQADQIGTGQSMSKLYSMFGSIIEKMENGTTETRGAFVEALTYSVHSSCNTAIDQILASENASDMVFRQMINMLTGITSALELAAQKLDLNTSHTSTLLRRS